MLHSCLLTLAYISLPSHPMQYYSEEKQYMCYHHVL